MWFGNSRRASRGFLGHGAHQATLLELAGFVPSGFESGRLCSRPCLTSESLRALHSNLAPPSRLRDGDQASNDLRVLALGRQLVAAVRECLGAIRKKVLILHLHEATAHVFRHTSLGIRLFFARRRLRLLGLLGSRG